MEIRKLLAVVIVVLFVPAFAALAFGQAASTNMDQGAQSGTDAGSSTDMEDTDTDMNTGTDSGSALTEQPAGPDLRPQEGTSPPPGMGAPPAAPSAMPPSTRTPADQSLGAPQQPSAAQPPNQSEAISPSGRETVIVKPAPDSAVIVPGPAVIVPAPQQQMPSAAPSDMGTAPQLQQAPGAAVTPVPTTPAQPGGYPSDMQQQRPPRSWAPGGFVEPAQGPDVAPWTGTSPPPGYPVAPAGREMKAPGTEPITIPSTSVVVPGAALPGPAMPGGMPPGPAVQQPMAPAPAPPAVQPAPSATQPGPALVPSPARPEASQPAMPSDQQSPDIIIITPAPQGSSAPGTMR